MSAPRTPALVGAARTLDDLEEKIVFVNHTRQFINETGHEQSGHGLWPALVRDEGSDDTSEEPCWISYESSSLVGRGDLLHIRVAGLSHRPESARRSKEGEPGELVRFVPEPTNPVNPNALAVYSSGGLQLGYVRDDDLGETKKALAAGWQGVSAFEWRLEDGARCGMHLLLAPSSSIAELQLATRGAVIA